MNPAGADVVGVGVLRPGAVPVLRPAPAVVAESAWPAYRLEEPPGTDLFPRARLKKLGRAQAMALTVVRRAVESCTVELEEVGLCVGTAWAELGHELAFLETMIRRGEIGARPAYFANSVHNALASKIAIEFGWKNENHTFTHDALSFESALWQGLQLLANHRATYAVVCGADALTDFLELRGHLLHHFRADPSPLDPLAETPARAGTIPGEGAAAFVLASPGGTRPRLAHIDGVVARGPKRRGVVAAREQLAFLEVALDRIGSTLDRVELVLCGANGDDTLDSLLGGILKDLTPRLAPGAGIGVYRHLTGDFATASALGLALAVRTVSDRAVCPEVRLVGPAPGDGPCVVLLYHLTTSGDHSAMLISP